MKECVQKVRSLQQQRYVCSCKLKKGSTFISEDLYTVIFTKPTKLKCEGRYLINAALGCEIYAYRYRLWHIVDRTVYSTYGMAGGSAVVYRFQL
jgi:hypothetical protein